MFVYTNKAMTSTRNKNTPGNYQSEQKQFQDKTTYLTQPFYGSSENTYLPGSGLLQGGVHHGVLSFNGDDVESFLFGIGSTNLVTNQPLQTTTQSKTLKSLNITTPRQEVQLPDPLTVRTDQRPYPLR